MNQSSKYFVNTKKKRMNFLFFELIYNDPLTLSSKEKKEETTKQSRIVRNRCHLLRAQFIENDWAILFCYAICFSLLAN